MKDFRNRQKIIIMNYRKLFKIIKIDFLFIIYSLLIINNYPLSIIYFVYFYKNLNTDINFGER